MLQLGLLLSFLGTITAAYKRNFGLHAFPKENSRGLQTANEFQMIYPENIVDESELQTSEASYKFIRISPLQISNDEVVSVSFYSSTPQTSDWIGAYSPEPSNVSATTPVKYGWCDDDVNYLTRGFGTLTFNLTNLREGVSFYYFTGGTKSAVLKAKSAEQVTFKNNNEPLRPRIVPTGDYDVFHLLWSSATSKNPQVKWGTSSGNYKYTVSASSSTIEKSDVCGAPANTIGWRDLGLIHTAELTGMKDLANTKIYYIFGDESTSDYSKEFSFLVPPLAGTQPPSRPTQVILYDDLGRGSSDMTYTWNEYGRPSMFTLQSVGALVADGQVDAIYHGGDISYATGYLAVWDFFMDMISPAASGTLYLTTVGNHESDWYDSASYFSNSDSGGECGVLTTKLIPMPAPAETNKPWWSYKVGLIHFIGMSTEHDFTEGSEQYKWLVNDLESVDRTVSPWIIFGGHRAMYINSDYGGTVNSDIEVMNLMIANLEPLLHKYRVNLGFYGHNHAVQRHSAVLNSTVIQKSEKLTDSSGNALYYHDDPQATVHLVVGTGGADFTKNAVTPPPVWNEYFYYEWGYAFVTAMNSSYLDWKWIDSENNKVIDHMVITQSDPTKPWST